MLCYTKRKFLPTSIDHIELKLVLLLKFNCYLTIHKPTCFTQVRPFLNILCKKIRHPFFSISFGITSMFISMSLYSIPTMEVLSNATTPDTMTALLFSSKSPEARIVSTILVELLSLHDEKKSKSGSDSPMLIGSYT